MWLEFFDNFNGVSPFHHHEWVGNDSLELFTDAAGSIGYGGYYNGHWFQGHWSPDILALSPSIAFMEFYPLVVAVNCWGPSLANRKINFRTDNSAVVHIINNQSSRCETIMKLVRCFVCKCLCYNISFKATHVAGVQNVIADSLSRFQMDRFRAVAPNADVVMTPFTDPI